VKLVRLIVAIFLLASMATTNVRYERIDTNDLLARADAYHGRLVAINGEICAVNANGKRIRLFDTETRALIDVQLTQLKKAKRNALIFNPIRHVSVFGRAESRSGKLVIEAHQIVTGR
jgi:hypothetical protein